MNSHVMLLTKKIVLVLIIVFLGSSFKPDPDPKEKKSDFILWQLPSQMNTVGNAYVFRMNNGKICVMDGGVKEETDYLRGFLASLGNEVEAWFISHPHLDHMGALNEILKDPKDVRIKNIYHFEMSKEYYNKYEVNYKPLTEEFYGNLKKSGINVVNVQTAGLVVKVGNTSFKVLNTKNEDLLEENPYNNQCMVVKVWDDAKSMVFLGDLGVEAGDKLLKSPYKKDLDCDYLQMAHHGQNGVSKDFYRSIQFKACLWPTPSWLWNNDSGKGYDSGEWETLEIRKLMDELGIKKHYIAWEGLSKIE